MGHKGNVALPVVEPRDSGLNYQCSATELRWPWLPPELDHLSEYSLNIELNIRTQILALVYFGLTADEKGVPVPSEKHRPVCRACKKLFLCSNTHDSLLALNDAS